MICVATMICVVAMLCVSTMRNDLSRYLRDLYPDLDINTHWHEDLLEAMKNDSRHFGLEQNEPLCVSTVPREGIVIRKDGDNIAEAFKLKSMTFLLYEGKRIESGAMDSEMMEGFAL